MKKRIYCLLLTLIIGTYISFAQQGKESEQIGGLRVGFHTAAMALDGSKPDTSKRLNGFYAGFYRDNKLASILLLGTGLEYFQNGIRYSENSKRILHTISIPVDLKVKLGPVFALGGLGLNFKVAERIRIGEESVEPMDADKSNWFDVPFFLGAGVKILFLTVETRYHWGLIESRNGLYNRYLQIGASVSF